MSKQRRAQVRQVDALDFENDQAVVIEPDEAACRPRWMVWHIRKDDGADGWVRRDWLQGVEQGFTFGEETAEDYWEEGR